ncbi:hypothetical protein [Plantactinospora endophytica]|uniref:DUF11 domain-containing protein n=1 Tax=Plantactinospora endophytica TaxID=673535 RepID=A0ABQ4DUM7_9ACTN|nr:hypothetical protein [Plantactinospora endophytica]GIG86156.1 hypothetical protein Pen02_10920 [Plantactinospora endophytica]
MRKIGFGTGRRQPVTTSAVLLAATLTVALAGCGSERTPPAGPVGAPTVTAGPTGVPTPTGVPATPTAETGTGAPATTAPTGPARGTGGAVTTPRRPTPARPAGTPRPPASYDPEEDITDLSAQTPGLRLRAPVNGIRHGDVTVTIRNNGPNPVWGLTFVVEVPESMTADGGDWSGCTPLRSRKAGFPAWSECDKGYLAPGQSRVYRLGMKSPAAKDGADSPISRWLVDVWSGGKRGEQYRDSGPDDNRRFFLVYRA